MEAPTIHNRRTREEQLDRDRWVRTWLTNSELEELMGSSDDETDDEDDGGIRWFTGYDTDTDTDTDDEDEDENEPEEEKLDITDEEATDETRILECKICLTNKICVVLSKCGHTFCYSCTTRFKHHCATCRTEFSNENVIRLYI